MSYDLAFATAEGVPTPTEDALVAYFGSRSGYEISGSQAWYSNDDTGVYFSFEFDQHLEPPEDWAEIAEEGEQWQPTIASFNLNYNRPSFFGLEAAPEVFAFVKEFGFMVDDPQIDGMGRGEFSVENFLSGWNKGNRWASSAVREQSSQDAPLTYPGERLVAIWKWNFARASRQAELGEALFVPKISFAVSESVVRSFCVWPDAIPALLPQVDDVLIVRDQLAQRRWFRKKEPETLLASWNAVEAVLGAYGRSAGPLPHIRLEYTEPPVGVVELVKRDWVTVTKETFSGVAPDSLLDAEFFE